MSIPPDSSPTLPILFRSGLELNDSLELFHTPDRKGYATVPVGDHMETYLINSPDFKHLLQREYYRINRKPLSGKQFKELMEQLFAQALFDGQNHTVHVRVAHKKIGGMVNKIYVDLTNSKWQTVEISSSGWQVMNQSPVKFRRPEGMAPLSTPMPDGSLEDLRPFINCRDEDWPLVIGWLVGAYSPGPYPLLVLQGGEGSAKSTTARILKTLVDPSQLSQSTKPPSLLDLFIAATNSWCLSFDNLSGISNSLSDAFCQLTHGTALRLKKNYKDTDETFLKAKRPLILNGIDNVLHRGDLASRSILLELPRINDESRRDEAEIRRDFEIVLPGILGALYTALSKAISNYRNVNLTTLPRMADFAKWVVAAEPALPWEPGTFLEAYEKNREGLVETSIAADPVALAVITLINRASLVRDTWQGTATGLLEALKTMPDGITDRDCPGGANVLTRRLNRLAPSLAKIGIEVDTKRSTATGRKIVIRKIS